MPIATFETTDGEEIEIDSDDVVRLAAGRKSETTLIELEDGDEITVIATELEVAAELGLNPLEYIDGEADDEELEMGEDRDENDPED
ncbi:hypothetical protein WSK_1525 [Novosphingobium sp. Rr 2-17]|uniref:hypothetical protein n=1 Tax=Novosphingobium sp. Rr 2-17 TaxID=555793 RepID=UPI00026994FC|nr:hypothetical protein [Novosphingobium sp. Rr 2-17]EIZ79849.1 hypothetical protein WSK_1525 [Novosphingobium sp. Rr 2-17]